MNPVLKLLAAGSIFSLVALCQTEEKPKFLAADIHVSAKAANQATRPPIARGEFLEARNVTMADLISFAYDSNATKVVGGPSWLEMDRFDVNAKQASQTPVEQTRLMLRALLAERFKLAAKEETQPMATFALTVSGKHKLKESDGSGDTGCKPQTSNAAPGPGTIRLMMANQSGGDPITLTLSDGMVEYKCRNMTMAAFTSGLRGMLAPNLGPNPILDQTNLAGSWNFDLRYSIGLIGLPGASGDQTTIFEAVDKQMGLKLEEKRLPTLVVAVQSVERVPTQNPPGTSEAFPQNAMPKEFEVATIKLTSPDSKRSMFQMQPGGRLNVEGMALTFLINRAFNPSNPGEVVDIPSWAGTTRFDVVAQAALGSNIALDPETVAPMMLSLLRERFGLKYHTEQRELPAYDLVAGKPKMKKADPASRSWCKAPAQVPGAAPAPQGSQALICQNVTMTQFAELLRGRTPDLQTSAGVVDRTGLEGGWDFRLTFNPVIGLVLNAAVTAPAGAGVTGPSPMASATEPVAGVSIFDAIDKQLGLKLEKVKRTSPVTVIDHIDQTPTEN
jgi:uncharacterized protein (TIGR03435 family)